MQFSLLRKGLVLTALLLMSTVATAIDVKPKLGMSAAFGGEEVIRIVMTDGSDQTIDANQGLYLYGGAVAGINELMDVDVAVGYKFAGISVSNGSSNFTRIPFDVIAMANVAPQFRAGAGIHYIMSPKLTCEITAVCTGTVNFENTLGFVLAGDYKIDRGDGKMIYVGLRYNMATIDHASGGNLKANGIGLYGALTF